jgi:hypothetical protein
MALHGPMLLRMVAVYACIGLGDSFATGGGAVAALYHPLYQHYAVRDHTLRRMLP